MATRKDEALERFMQVNVYDAAANRRSDQDNIEMIKANYSSACRRGLFKSPRQDDLQDLLNMIIEEYRIERYRE